MAQQQISGVWRCTYRYPSNQHDGEESTEYLMDAVQRKDKVVFESRPKDDGSHMTVNLTVEGKIATGSWLENTAQQGEFEGTVHSGAVQLLTSDDGRRLEGKWVGIGREHLADGSYEPRIYCGDWLLEAVQDSDAEAAASGPAAITGTTNS